MKSFRDLIARWPSAVELAEDVGTTVHRVRKWRSRDSIPAEYWHDVLRAAKRRGFRLSAEDMVRMARTGRSEAA